MNQSSLKSWKNKHWWTNGKTDWPRHTAKGVSNLKTRRDYACHHAISQNKPFLTKLDSQFWLIAMLFLQKIHIFTTACMMIWIIQMSFWIRDAFKNCVSLEVDPSILKDPKTSDSTRLWRPKYYQEDLQTAEDSFRSITWWYCIAPTVLPKSIDLSFTTLSGLEKGHRTLHTVGSWRFFPLLQWM